MYICSVATIIWSKSARTTAPYHTETLSPKNTFTQNGSTGAIQTSALFVPTRLSRS
ncbi:MAG: hypothetical protein IPN94_20855 [Sphingobacteriales bacterium]|nr:hypothetical protein [Sphingobacteriales bacterium]